VLCVLLPYVRAKNRAAAMAAKSSAGARILAREEVRVLGIPNRVGVAAPPRPNIDPPLILGRM
jgi:hypothetical protein